ncbi:unnamed protein product [Schistosoma curassoni]|uniref:UBP-type domain-containing protein n=1 Tax=Schistosoma curassoni TaxID=6186 RepID=A0A183K8P3_9TREM|nr:unnamed protein product [Schistosoma curassoni]
MTVVHLNPSVYTLNHRKDSPIISTPTRQTRQRLQQEKSISYSGGLVLALEGGYQLTALSQCVAYCVAALLGDYCPRLASNLSISEKSCKSMQQTIEIHANYWNMLKGFDPVDRLYDQDSIRRPVIGRNTRQNPQNTTTTTPTPISNSINTTIELSCSSDLVHSKLNNLNINDRQFNTKFNSSLNNTNDRLSSPSISKQLSERQNVHEENSYETLNNNSESTVAKTSGVVIDPSESYQQQQQQPSTSNGNSFISEDIHDFFGLPSSHELTPHVFAVTPLSWCPHLTFVQNNPNWKPDINSLCSNCNHSSENWVCLSCYAVYCGRYANSHMIEHFTITKHSIVLSYADLSTWCYECESYVHNEVLFNMKRAVYQAKFSEDMPSSY